MDKYGKLALEECCSGEKSVHPGGVDGSPFWNIHSSQFMYVPKLMFPRIPGAAEYIYTAIDSKSNTYSFRSTESSEFLTPIWKDLEPGIVELKVEGVNPEKGTSYISGVRTFCKMESFPGRESLPKKACTYRECALKALKYVFNDETTRHWLTHGVPKPDYYHNVYPSKTISSVIRAMVTYSKLDPDNAADAIKLACNAADYLLSITYGSDTGVEGLPPTYSFKGLIKEIVDKNAPPADKRKHLLMVQYPASVGAAYLLLEKVTGDAKYLEAAKKIVEYYKKSVLPNGSWHIFVSVKTGEKASSNFCDSYGIIDFLSKYYERTGDEECNTLKTNYYSYFVKKHLENYNWEGQFEDSGLSENYSNLTHFDAGRTAGYICKNFRDNKEMMDCAEELMRYIEDQFVVWGKFAPWSSHEKDVENWFSPAGLEQYYWYVPIDGSTACIATAFLNLYKATGNEMYREKAYALGDSITRMQNPDTGIIPTHWTTANCNTEIQNFWINCHIGTAFAMMELAESNGEV